MHANSNIDIKDSSLEQSLQISKSELGGAFYAARARVGGTVEIDRDKINGKVDFTDLLLGVDINLKDTTFSTYASNDNVDDGVVFLKGAHIGGNIYLGPNLDEKSGGLNLLEVKVDGNIEISKSVFAHNFLLPLAHVGQSVFIHENVFKKEIY